VQRRLAARASAELDDQARRCPRRACSVRRRGSATADAGGVLGSENAAETPSLPPSIL